jgi:hypothetical protein
MKSVSVMCFSAFFAVAVPAGAQMTPTQRTTSDGRPLASSLPAKSAGARASSRPLQFQELGQNLGRRVVLVTEYGDRKEGIVDSVSGSTLHLKINAGLGYAVTNFERSHIRSITLMP